jgi:hypothetical protein
MQPVNFDIEIKELAGEAIGWIPLEDRTYLHLSSEGRQDRVVITGLPDAGLDGENVLLFV